MDSVRFLRKVSDHDPSGNLVCRSIDAFYDGNLKRIRGRLMEGVGYCADTIFGAHMLVRLARVLGRPELEEMGWSYLQHTLEAGFFDDSNIPVRLYRNAETGELADNLEGRDSHVEFGHIAKVAYELLCLSFLDHDPNRASRLREICRRTAEWSAGVERCENGWYPRRCTPSGGVFRLATDAFGPVNLESSFYPDPIYDCSGAGVFVIHLLAETTRLGLFDATSILTKDITAFIKAGGLFGSTNTDTEDRFENVSYAVAFQALFEAARILEDASIMEFAYQSCLEPLTQFELVTDINGLETKGLLWMEESWNSACMWEIAEASQAYLIAYGDRGQRQYASKALTMLRAAAKHHHGPYGFLTEAVDWDGHSNVARHIGEERYADIRETHPFLNNLYIVEPTVTYLERFAARQADPLSEGQAFFDFEGNRLGPITFPFAEWMRV